MAANADSTPLPTRAEPTREALAEAMDALSGPIDDARRAIILLEAMHDEAMLRTRGEEITRRSVPGFRMFLLTADQDDGLKYAIFHVGTLLRDLSRAYFAAYGEGPPDERSISGAGQVAPHS